VSSYCREGISKERALALNSCLNTEFSYHLNRPTPRNTSAPKQPSTPRKYHKTGIIAPPPNTPKITDSPDQTLFPFSGRGSPFLRAHYANTLSLFLAPLELLHRSVKSVSSPSTSFTPALSVHVCAREEHSAGSWVRLLVAVFYFRVLYYGEGEGEEDCRTGHTKHVGTAALEIAARPSYVYVMRRRSKTVR
jgi:hypothetical protein